MAIQKYLSDINPIIAIEQATQDNTLAQLIQAGGKLVGDAVQSSVTGQLQEEIGTLTAGYEAGKLSSSEANLRASTIYKNYANKHPYWANDFKRAIGDAGGGLFPQTREEKADDAAYASAEKAKQDLINQSQEIGIPVVAIQAHNRAKFLRDARKDALDAQAEEGTVSLRQTIGVINDQSATFDTEWMTALSVTADRQGLTEEQRQDWKLAARAFGSQQKQYLSQKSNASMSQDDIERQEKAIDDATEARINAVSDTDFLKQMQDMAGLRSAAAKLDLWQSVPDLMLARELDPRLVGEILRADANPVYAALRSRINPEADESIQRAGMMGAHNLRVSKALRGYGTLDSQFELDSAAGLATTTVNDPTTDTDTVEAHGSYILEQAVNEGNTQALQALSTPAARANVLKTTDLKAKIPNEMDSLIARVFTKLQLNPEALNNIAGFKVRYKTKTERKGSIFTGDATIVSTQVPIWTFVNEAGLPIETAGNTALSDINDMLQFAETYPEVTKGKTMQEYGDYLVGVFTGVGKKDTTDTDTSVDNDFVDLSEY